LNDPARVDRKPILVSFWYPAVAQAGVLPGFYIDSFVAADWAVLVGGSPTTYRSAHGHALPGVPIATNEGKYPIDLYSPGGGDVRTECTDKAENLASHGFIVAAIDPVECFASAQPDGRVEYGFKPESLIPQLADRVSDVRFVFDEMGRWNADDPLFAGRLDVDRMGVFGYSFGGATTAEVCGTDARCKAAASLDGGAHPFVVGLSFAKPFLIFSGNDGSFVQSQRTAFRSLYDKLVTDAYWLNLNAPHSDFGEWPWFGAPTDTIKIRTATILRTFLVSFFNKYLRNVDDHLLDGPSAAYPEISPFLRK
jgi:predicted dienelactone hydrolase